MNAYKTTLATALSAALMAAGCAGTPARNSDLETAQAAVAAAKSDQRVLDHAPVQLREAQEDLSKAESLAEDRHATELVSHYAYLAAREAQTASALGEAGAVKEAIEQTGEERDRIRLEAREHEADQAKSQAAMAQNEAMQQRARADDMAQRLAELQAKQTERGLVLTLQDVLFDVGRAELKPGAQRTIDDLAAFMRDYPERRVRIEGFTDSTGSSEYNEQLSESRAHAVRDALLDAGVDSRRIEVRGYGEEYPVASNDTTAGRQLNRRVEVIISDEGGTIPARSMASS
jgi:outer membrane protein OmpA-like peptidoglycan-associated protein